MSYDPTVLTRRLELLARDHGAAGRYVAAFSGGMDSAVLLHSLSVSTQNRPVLALHIDHGLNDASASWADHAREFAGSLGVPFEVVRVEVDPDSVAARGLEAAAREARYRVFEKRLGDGDWLLSAHHRDDQGETLLLNLLRGSGPLGLAGMPAARRLGGGWLVRPLLDVGRAELYAYAEAAGLDWLDDPANADPRFDRNFLRRDILPPLASRWPDVTARLAKSAALSAEAQGLLDDLAAHDLDEVGLPPGDRLSIDRLCRLAPARQRNLLRYVCRILALPLPPAARLETALADVPAAADDAQPLVAWDGAEIRRYRDALFVSATLAERNLPGGCRLDPGAVCDLGPRLGRLALARVEDNGIRASVAEDGLSVAFRRGGERLRVRPGGPTRPLKKLLQEEGVLPWMRDRLPLLFQGDELIAVADLWVNADFLGPDGYRVVWHDPPTLR